MTDRAEGPQPDCVLTDIAAYVTNATIHSREAYDTARLCLMDALACAMLALGDPDCTRLLGPIVPGATMAGGARVVGTGFELDPVQAAFNLGCLIRWLDYNDTWLAAEWGHPSDNLGGILACADYLSRRNATGPSEPMVMRRVLTAMIQAYEIQGVIALDNAFNRVGLDHVILVRVATAAVVVRLLGGSHQQVINAVSNAWLDGGPLRAYRQAPNTGSRKSWAAGDATSRGVRLALLSHSGEMGYLSALSSPTWGFHDALLRGAAVTLRRPFGCYVIENILFKVSYPAEFHGQTAVEAAIRLHPEVRDRLGQIARISIWTQESALRIIDKTGPLRNPADRDHCLQYMVAVALIHGGLVAAHYRDEAARDPRLDWLRQRMEVSEDPSYSRDYLDSGQRSIANAVQIFFTNGQCTERVEVMYPLGHRRRRTEALPLLRCKFEENLALRLPARHCHTIRGVFDDPEKLDAMAVHEFVALFVAECP